MNTENPVMNRVVELEKQSAVREQARLSVAEEILSHLEPQSCRTMALGIADLMTSAEPEFDSDKAVQHGAWAIATLLRVAEKQEEAEQAAMLD